MEIATKLIKLDQDRRLRYEDDKAPLKKEERSELMRPRPQRPYFRGSAGGPTSGFIKEIENYTSLNAPRSQVLMWIRANGVGIPTPRRLSPNKIAVADKRFYC